MNIATFLRALFLYNSSGGYFYVSLFGNIIVDRPWNGYETVGNIEVVSVDRFK